MEQHKKTRAFVLSFLSLAAAYPLATLPLATVMNQSELFDQAVYRQQRRDYAKAMSQCSERRAKGEPELVCPDVNDNENIQRFLDGKPAQTSHEAAKKQLKESDLTPAQVAILRRYTRVRSCPQALKDVLPGFYELCRSVINMNGTRIKGMPNADANNAMNNPVKDLTLEDVAKAKSFKRPKSY